MIAVKLRSSRSRNESYVLYETGRLPRVPDLPLDESGENSSGRRPRIGSEIITTVIQ